jgi:ferredoxin
MLDLAKTRDVTAVLDAIKAAGPNACLFVGSPVYRDVAIPPVMRFVEALPETAGALAVPFVTWGGACSGVALWQLGDTLTRKGFRIVGAAKVLAVHSMMWRVQDPAGKGHPDESDTHRIEELVDTLAARFSSGEAPVMSLDALDYQPLGRSEQMKKKINVPWMIVPKQVDETACTQCGVCEERCPVEAVSLSPYPKFDPKCFDCFNCIRLCPEDAIHPATSVDQIEAHIRERVRTINERPGTQIFL